MVGEVGPPIKERDPLCFLADRPPAGVVSGLGGEDQYDQRFTGWVSDLNKLLKAEPGAKVDTLSGKDATKANIEAKLRALASTKADDSFMLVLIGNGTYDDLDYKFNIPGPDISATEIAALLDLTLANVQQIMSRSLRKLRSLLEPQLDHKSPASRGTED